MRAHRIVQNATRHIGGRVGVLLFIPKLGVSMTEGAIAEWLVADGDAVTEGDALYVLETDKTEAEVAAPAAGVIRIEADAGERYPVGTCMGEIG
jgi:pyruvate/2-oxoglutarate dehydrogenase complex dihydrolipoamide acyltransferase (E2) component